MRRALAAFAALTICASAQAQQPSSVSGAPPTAILPYPYAPLPPGQHNVTLTSATPLTTPAGAVVAIVCAQTSNVTYTTDGVTTPSASVGMQLYAGSCVSLTGAAVLANFNAFSSSGTLDIEYFK
jgi:hypothetical protein